MKASPFISITRPKGSYAGSLIIHIYRGATVSSNDNHEVIVKNIVLHIPDSNIGTPVLSNQEIEPDGEGFDFVENLILKMPGNYMRS